MKSKLLTILLSITVFQSYSQEFKKTQDKTGLVAEDQYNGTNINVGIGVAYPTARFEVNGPIKLHSSAKLDSILSIGNKFTLNGINGAFSNKAWITNNISNRILITDAMGNISPLAVGTANQVLYGNGSWGNLPSVVTSWNIVGNNLVNSNSGYVGIGNSNPQYLLDVNGDAHISNNLYVDGKILISDRVESGIVRSDSIVMDSATVIIGDPTIGGDITAKSKLDVLGNARFLGQLNAQQGVLFDAANNIGMKFTPGATPGTGNYIIGNISKILPVACSAIPQGGLNYGIGANLQIFDPFSSNPNPSVLNIQSWTGGSSIDASTAGNTSSGLLINYFCGSNTFINTGTNKGTVYMGKTVIGPLTQKVAPHNDAYLTIDGKVVAKSLYVTQQNWADFVFNNDYSLPSWEETENYYNKNKHLKGVPTTKEIMTNGNNLAETDLILLQKIEEAYLYIAQLKKEVKEIKELNIELLNEMKTLKK